MKSERCNRLIGLSLAFFAGLILSSGWFMPLAQRKACAQEPTGIVRVSIASNGTPADKSSYFPAVSGDGRFVVFSSEASNLVSDDTNGVSDVFVHDRETGETFRASVASDGTQGDGASGSDVERQVAISANGRYVAFSSEAGNLVPGDTNEMSDVFVHDLQTHATTRASVRSDGSQAYGGSGGQVAISADGRFVAFGSGDVLIGFDADGDGNCEKEEGCDVNNDEDIYVHDRLTGKTTLVSVSSDGAQANIDCYSPSISGDGRFVAFWSLANTLVKGDANKKWDIFMHDRQTGQTTLASTAPDGTQANDLCRYPALSYDGRFIAFQSWATNLVSGDTNNTGDVFVKDWLTGQVTRVSVASDGAQGDDESGDDRSIWISDDGRFVAFDSDAKNLVSETSSFWTQVYVHDRQTAKTAIVSVANDGTIGNHASRRPSLAAGGSFVVFESMASNFVTGDSYGSNDIFLQSLGSGCNTLTTSVSPSYAGRVTASPAKECYDSKESVTLNAVPNEGYIFDHWSGALSGTVNPAVLTMNGAQSVTANFVDKPVLDKVSDGKKHGELEDPVNTASGEFFFTLPVMDLGGPLPLQFNLYYGSGVYRKTDIDRTFGRVMGYNWLHNYSMMRIHKGDTVTHIIYDNGKILKFLRSGASWEPAIVEDTPYQLRTDAAGNFLMMDPSTDHVYTFNVERRLESVEDRNGNKHHLAYDANGLLTAVKDGLGRKLTFVYDGARLVRVCGVNKRCASFSYSPDGLMTGYTDAAGQHTAYEYDPTNRYKGVISRIVLPKGNSRTAQAYDGNGRVLSQTDAYGSITQLAINDDGHSDITYPDDTSVEHTHAEEQFLTGYTDQTGQGGKIGYNESNQRSSVTDRTGDKTVITHHAASGKVASITNPMGKRMNYSYASQEQVIGGAAFTFHDLAGVAYPDGTKESFTCDARGNITSRVDRAAKTWNLTYNARGQVLTVRNSVGGVATYTYNGDATIATTKDSDTGVTTYKYDVHKRPSEILYPGGSKIKMAHDAMDRTISVANENGRSYRYAYDANGNPISVTDPSGKKTLYGFDLMDRVAEVTDKLGKVTTMAYDKMGHISSITDPSQVKVLYGYEPRGWLTDITMGSETWKRAYDDEGVILANTTPMNRRTAYETDKLGYLSKVTDPLGKATKLERDAMSRVSTVTDPLLQVFRYGYDANGLLAKITLPDIGSISYARDSLGLVKQITDSEGGLWTFAYTPMGRVKTFTDPLNNQWKHTYDARGRTAETLYPDTGTQTITRDNVGNITRRRYSDGTDLPFAYDSLNRLSSTHALVLRRDAEGRVIATDNGGDLFNAAYDHGGRLKSVTYKGSTFKVTYSYDKSTGLLSQVTDDLTHTLIRFAYDTDRRLIRIERSNKVNTSFTWDNADRLVRIQDGKIIDARYTLDATGKITQSVIKAPLDPADLLSSSEQEFTFDAASQLSTQGYAYDPLGRLTSSPFRAFTWDGASRLKELDKVKFTHNGLGDLLIRNEGGVSIRYIYNHAIGLTPIVAEKHANSGNFMRYYVYTPDGRLLYMIDALHDNKVYFHHFDHAGSALALTDSSGKVTDSYAYSPYGALLGHKGANPQPFTFAGQWGVRQEGSGGTLYQMRARYYDATTSRFVSREPIWPRTADPRLLNPYQYAMSNPLYYVDMTGEGPVGPILKAGGKYLAKEGAGKVAEKTAETGFGEKAGTVVELGLVGFGGRCLGFIGLLLGGTTLGSGEIDEGPPADRWDMQRGPVSSIESEDRLKADELITLKSMEEVQRDMKLYRKSASDLPEDLYNKVLGELEHNLQLKQERLQETASRREELQQMRIMLGLRELPWKTLKKKLEGSMGSTKDLKLTYMAMVSKSLQEGDWRKAREYMNLYKRWQ